MNVLESLIETEKQLKNDLDAGPNWPEWWRLKTIFNFLQFPNAEMTVQSKTGSIHQFSSIPSNLDIRRGIPDCRGRLYVSDRRKQMIGAHGDIIYRKGKGKFKFMNVKGKLLKIWIRRPTPDVPIDLRDVLHLPFTLRNQPTHLKRTLRYNKRKEVKT